MSTRHTLQPPSSIAWVTRSPSSPCISMPPPLACSISSASSTPAAAGTTAFAPAPSGCPGASGSTWARPARRSAWRARSPRCRGWPQALARGELSYAKVRALTRVATPETEERLLAIGRAGTAEHVERIVRGWRRMDRKAERDEAARQHTSRALHVYPAEDGTVTIRGRLSPEAGALLLKALTAAREALYQRERAARAARSARGRFRGNADDGSAAGRRAGAARRDRAPPRHRSRHAGRALPGGGPCRRRRAEPIPISPASPSSKTAHAFPRKRPSAWRATRAGW